MISSCWLHLSLASAVLLLTEVRGLGEVVYAVNCGGEMHTDVYGIRYAKDANRIGTASDYGKQLVIGRVSGQDQILYQTERYHTSSFSYDIPVQGDGWYLLVLKFSEVYFNGPQLKVFDVGINGDLPIVTELDIHGIVGRGVAHDEYIELEVKDGKIFFHQDGVSHESELTKGKMKVEFIKSYRDNPKVNAIVLMKGRLRDWNPLPPLPAEPDEDDVFDQDSRDSSSSKNRNPSGPKTRDPYEMDDSSTMLPIFVAIGAFIPLLFCMCKL